MKKIVALALALVMMLSLTSVFAEDEVVTLKVASIWSAETEANRKPMLKTIEEFEAAYPNIKLEVEWYEANAWKETGETLALSDSLPDVFYWNAGGVLWNLVGSGDILALDSYLTDDIMARMEPGLLADMTFTVDGKEYTISVKGDPSGDGKVSVTDVVKLQSHLLNKATLSGAYLKAADFNGDDKVTITDLVKAARVVAGKEKIS